MNDDQRRIPGSEWNIVNAPAVGVQATASHHVVPINQRHVIKSMTFTSYGTTASVVQVMVRDGLSGLGTVIWTGYISWAAGPAVGAAAQLVVTFPDCGLKGSYSTDITVECANAAPNALQSVSATGYMEDRYIKTPDLTQNFGG